MRTNRKGSRTFVVLACKGHYASGGRSVRIQIFQRDRISGHNANWRKGPAQFCRQDFVHIVIVLILNAAPCSDRTVRRKRYRSGLVLWTTLLSIIPQYEASDIECAGLRWPLALRRRFFTALYQRRRERWPFSPFSTSNELQKPIERMKIASVYDLSVRMPMFQRS